MSVEYMEVDAAVGDSIDETRAKIEEGYGPGWRYVGHRPHAIFYRTIWERDTDDAHDRVLLMLIAEEMEALRSEVVGLGVGERLSSLAHHVQQIALGRSADADEIVGKPGALQALMEDLVESADTTGCSEDLVVVNNEMLRKLALEICPVVGAQFSAEVKPRG